MKIRVEVPEDDGSTSGECVWARKVGEDLYELRNSPWLTQEFNFCDVVRAVSPEPGSLPEFVEVSRRSGHRTIQIIFADNAEEKWDAVRSTLRGMGVGAEHAAGGLYAINLPPHIHFDEVADYLEACQDKGWLNHYYAAQPQPKGSDDPVQ